MTKPLSFIGLFLLPISLPLLLSAEPIVTHWGLRLAFSGLFLGLTWVIEQRSRPKLLLIISFIILLGVLKELTWLIPLSWFTLNLIIGRYLWTNTSRLTQITVGIIISLIVGSTLTILNTIQLNFAEEEFFSLLEGVYLSLFWLSLAIAYQIITPTSPLNLFIKPPFFIIYSGIILSSCWLLLNQYQQSFFPTTAPTYPQITEENPFLCDTLPSTPLLESQSIQKQFIQLLENAPKKNTLALGVLALYTNQANYAQAYHESLLQEARIGLYTGPANSIKWGQFEAAQRAYQLSLIKQAKPDLFSAQEWQILQQWFAAINQRTMTPEWVDWLYATAYGRYPQGPYLNQEIGTGLLAILEKNRWADPQLSSTNQAYLATMPLGWSNLFRNTDDSYSYQSVWLYNAWWLHNYQNNPADDKNMRLSFAWLLALALPDGESLSYNFDGTPPMTEAYFMGAQLTNDPRLMWLATQSIAQLEAQGSYINGKFTLGSLPAMASQIPNVGSCLLYGNSGIATTKGPLAPDKVVLREGWVKDSMVALLNLRFTGWHRYKATNALTLLYQQGSLVSEQQTGEDIWWLPKGRSAFRDKRIPRENLNGLLIPKNGLAKTLWIMTGLGSQWAQNPPAYASVDRFFTSPQLDSSRTIIQDWQGWQHERTLYLIKHGLFIVIDQATNPNAQPASLVWHVTGDGQRLTNGLSLANNQRPAKMVWLNEANDFITLSPKITSEIKLHSPNWQLLYTPPASQTLHFATAFLTNQGDITLTSINQGVQATWENEQIQAIVLHGYEPGHLASTTLKTNGRMVMMIEDKQKQTGELCYEGGNQIELTLRYEPKSISGEGSWEIKNNTLYLQPPSPTGCITWQ